MLLLLLLLLTKVPLDMLHLRSSSSSSLAPCGHVSCMFANFLLPICQRVGGVAVIDDGQLADLQQFPPTYAREAKPPVRVYLYVPLDLVE
jgi:hypothetical protein